MSYIAPVFQLIFLKNSQGIDGLNKTDNLYMKLKLLKAIRICILISCTTRMDIRVDIILYI